MAAAAGAPAMRKRRGKELDGLRVTLDVGHGYDPQGRYDPGTSTWDSRQRTWLDEYDLNQGACGRAATLLESQGADVVLLGNERGNGLTLEGRAQAAKEHRSHVFVSCHHNASNGVTQGSENFIHTAGTWADYSLARNIQDSLVERLGDLPNFADRGVKRGRMLLLESLPSNVEAACLTEAYFIDSTPSHRPAGAKLSAEAGDAIAGGVRQYWLELHHPELAGKSRVGLGRKEYASKAGRWRRIGGAFRLVGGLCIRAHRLATPLLVRAATSAQGQTLIAFGLGFATSKGLSYLLRALQAGSTLVPDDTPVPVMCAPPLSLVAEIGAPAMEGECDEGEEEETLDVDSVDSDEESDSDEELLDALEDCESDPTDVDAEMLAVVAAASEPVVQEEPPHEMTAFFKDCKKEISVLVRKIEGWKSIYREAIGNEPSSSASAEASRNPAVASVLYDCLSEAEVHLSLLTESYVMRKVGEGYKSRAGTPTLPVIQAAEARHEASAIKASQISQDVPFLPSSSRLKGDHSGSSSPRCVLVGDSGPLSASGESTSSSDEDASTGSGCSSRAPSPLPLVSATLPSHTSPSAKRTWRGLIGMAPAAPSDERDAEPITPRTDVGEDGDSDRSTQSHDSGSGAEPLRRRSAETDRSSVRLVAARGRVSMDDPGSPENKYRRALTQLVESLRSPTKAPHPP